MGILVIAAHLCCHNDGQVVTTVSKYGPSVISMSCANAPEHSVRSIVEVLPLGRG